MLHASGDGPLLIRIGGNSADHTFWEPTVRSMPRWMFQLTPRGCRRRGRWWRTPGCA